MGPHRQPDRDLRDERRRALRLAQDRAGENRCRPSQWPHRRTPALDLQAAVKLKARCLVRTAYGKRAGRDLRDEIATCRRRRGSGEQCHFSGVGFGIKVSTGRRPMREAQGERSDACRGTSGPRGPVPVRGRRPALRSAPAKQGHGLQPGTAWRTAGLSARNGGRSLVERRATKHLR